MTTDELRQRLAGHADSEAIGIAITELEARDREIAQLREDPFQWWHSAQRVNAELREGVQVGESAAYRWWKQARQNNYHAWAHLRNLERALAGAEAEARGNRREIELLEQEVAEYKFIFELGERRTVEAMNVWREATGRHNVIPDLGVLVEWLLEYREHADRLAEALDYNFRGNVAPVALQRYYAWTNRRSIKGTTDRDIKTCSDLCQVLIEFIERDHDYGCECSACRAIAAYRNRPQLSRDVDSSIKESTIRDTKVAPETTITQEET